MKSPEEMRQIAKNNFLSGHNCSQAVVSAFFDELGEEVFGMNKETAQRMAAPFGGGMSRLREICGSVSGMFMVAGLLYGYGENDPKSAKGEHYARIQELAKTYAARNGTIICRDLLGLPPKTASFQPESPKPEERTEQYYKKRPCADLAGEAAAILAQMIIDDPPAKGKF